MPGFRPSGKPATSVPAPDRPKATSEPPPRQTSPDTTVDPVVAGRNPKERRWFRIIFRRRAQHPKVWASGIGTSIDSADFDVLPPPPPTPATLLPVPELSALQEHGSDVSSISAASTSGVSAVTGMSTHRANGIPSSLGASPAAGVSTGRETIITSARAAAAAGSEVDDLVVDNGHAALGSTKETAAARSGPAETKRKTDGQSASDEQPGATASTTETTTPSLSASHNQSAGSTQTEISEQPQQQKQGVQRNSGTTAAEEKPVGAEVTRVTPSRHSVPTARNGSEKGAVETMTTARSKTVSTGAAADGTTTTPGVSAVDSAGLLGVAGEVSATRTTSERMGRTATGDKVKDRASTAGVISSSVVTGMAVLCLHVSLPSDAEKGDGKEEEVRRWRPAEVAGTSMGDSGQALMLVQFTPSDDEHQSGDDNNNAIVCMRLKEQWNRLALPHSLTEQEILSGAPLKGDALATSKKYFRPRRGRSSSCSALKTHDEQQQQQQQKTDTQRSRRRERSDARQHQQQQQHQLQRRRSRSLSPSASGRTHSRSLSYGSRGRGGGAEKENGGASGGARKDGDGDRVKDKGKDNDKDRDRRRKGGVGTGGSQRSSGRDERKNIIGGTNESIINNTGQEEKQKGKREKERGKDTGSTETCSGKSGGSSDGGGGTTAAAATAGAEETQTPSVEAEGVESEQSAGARANPQGTSIGQDLAGGAEARTKAGVSVGVGAARIEKMQDSGVEGSKRSVGIVKTQSESPSGGDTAAGAVAVGAERLAVAVGAEGEGDHGQCVDVGKGEDGGGRGGIVAVGVSFGQERHAMASPIRSESMTATLNNLRLRCRSASEDEGGRQPGAEVAEQEGREESRRLPMPGDKFDCLDFFVSNQTGRQVWKWREAEVVDVRHPPEGTEVLVHFITWASKWNRWVSLTREPERFALHLSRARPAEDRDAVAHDSSSLSYYRRSSAGSTSTASTATATASNSSCASHTEGCLGDSGSTGGMSRRAIARSHGERLALTRRSGARVDSDPAAGASDAAGNGGRRRIGGSGTTAQSSTTSTSAGASNSSSRSPGLSESDSMGSSSDSQFREAMRRQGLSVIDVEPDGNCLFRSVSHQIFGDAERHGQVRKACVEHMTRHRARFGVFVAEDFRDYLYRIRQLGVWGDDLEIRALEELFDRPIEIFSSEAEDLRPMKIDFDSGLNLETVPIKLSYHGQSHYNSVRDHALKYPLNARRSKNILHMRQAQHARTPRSASASLSRIGGGQAGAGGGLATEGVARRQNGGGFGGSFGGGGGSSNGSISGSRSSRFRGIRQSKSPSFTYGSRSRSRSRDGGEQRSKKTGAALRTLLGGVSSRF